MRAPSRLGEAMLVGGDVETLESDGESEWGSGNCEGQGGRTCIVRRGAHILRCCAAGLIQRHGARDWWRHVVRGAVCALDYRVYK